jgi:hypothetical protein
LDPFTFKRSTNPSKSLRAIHKLKWVGLLAPQSNFVAQLAEAKLLQVLTFFTMALTNCS